MPLVWGTFVIAFGLVVIALPIGLLSADLSERIRPAAARGGAQAALELLAGIPTIVYGYLALLLVTPVLKAVFEPLGIRVPKFNAL